MQIKYSVILFIAVVIFASCEEPFQPELKNQKSFLVVDGVISNDTGPYTVKLSESAGVDSARYIPESGALVVLINDSGQEDVMSEKKEGTYVSSGLIQGQIGSLYKLHVELTSGETYETEYQEIKNPVAIDSFYYRRELYESPVSNEIHDGYRFYVSTDVTDNNSTYLMWRMTETYEYNSVYKIDYIYFDGLHEFSNPDTLYTCWRTNEIPIINTFSASSSDPIYEFPLTFVSKDTKKLSVGYSLQLRQYNINEETYNYWNALEDMNNQSGNLYSQQPYQLIGNLKNINNPDEIVLGYFIVAGVESKRIFAEPRLQTNSYSTNCVVDDLLLGNLLRFGGAGIYYVTENESGTLGVVSTGCVDCTLKGGVTTKPDFWIY